MTFKLLFSRVLRSAFRLRLVAGLGRMRRPKVCPIWKSAGDSGPGDTGASSVRQDFSLNSAKIANSPAARYRLILKSSTSVNETKPAPRCSSSSNVARRSVTERLLRSSVDQNVYTAVTGCTGFLIANQLE